MELIKREKGVYRLNNICYLNRWTKTDFKGDKMDFLALCFDNINGVCFDSWTFIQARDYEGIIAECQKAIDEYLIKVANRLTKDLQAGYRNATYIGG